MEAATPETGVDWAFRDPTATDVPFLLNSWLKSSRDVGDHALMTNAVYYDGFREECVRKLAIARVTIACNPQDPDQIYGWLCWGDDPQTVHYVYVKHPYRKFGVAKSLLADALPGFGKRQTAITTLSRTHKAWASKYLLEYDPYTWSK
jgi:hypothetical protein